MTIKKIKVIDKDISDFSVDRTKKEIGEIKIDWTMTNNLLIEETLDELIKGMEIDKSTFYKSYKALPLAIYIENRRFQNLHCTKVYVPKHVSLPKAFIEASNKSNIVIFIALLFVI
jgi:hypothetical protein